MHCCINVKRIFAAIALAYCIEKLGCGRTTIIAALLTAISFLISVFLNSIILLYITLGTFGGE